jgi:predicted MFS family arabinose efflux permease
MGIDKYRDLWLAAVSTRKCPGLTTGTTQKATSMARGDIEMSTPNSFGGKVVLIAGHVAGLVDMVALPLWIGALIQYYHYSPEQAGLMVTIFLFGALVASMFVAPRFNRLPRRIAAAGGYAAGAVAFFLVGQQPLEASNFQPFAALHAVAGLGVGCALSFAHGCMGRSANPHRIFGIAHFALGVFALAFLSLVPQAIQHVSATMLFKIIAGVMLAASIMMAIGFPDVPGDAIQHRADNSALPTKKIPRAAWFIIGVVMCLQLNQAMVFSFVERVGADHGFGIAGVNAALIALGFVNLFPGGLAALLQKRLSPIMAGIAGPVGQAVLAMTIFNATLYLPYAVAASLFVSMAIFTHVFLFGLLSRLDTSGRAVAATPAMLMVGSCIGPALGGAIVQGVGYPGLGWAACVIAGIAIASILLVRYHMRSTGATVATIPVGRHHALAESIIE